MPPAGERTVIHQAPGADPWLIVQPRKFDGLDPAQLRHVRQMALEELAASVLGGAEREHLEKVAQLAARVDARLDRLDG